MKLVPAHYSDSTIKQIADKLEFHNRVLNMLESEIDELRNQESEARSEISLLNKQHAHALVVIDTVTNYPVWLECRVGDQELLNTANTIASANQTGVSFEDLLEVFLNVRDKREWSELSGVRFTMQYQVEPHRYFNDLLASTYYSAKPSPGEFVYWWCFKSMEDALRFKLAMDV